MSIAHIRNTIRIYPQTHAVRRMRGVYVETTGHIIVDTINADGDAEIVELDFSTVPLDEDGRFLVLGSTADFVRSIYLESKGWRDQQDRFWFELDWYHATGEEPATTHHNVSPGLGQTYPAYGFWGSQPQVKPTRTVFYHEELSYPDKQARAVTAMQTWREQKRAWLAELIQRTDLGQDVIEHGGYWLRSADRALQYEFQRPGTDPLVVAKMAQLAIQGATDIDTVDKFAISLHEVTAVFPDGPTTPRLWVRRGDGQNVEDVSRTDLTHSYNYGDDNVEMPEDYNPIDSEWVLPNQLGLVTVDNLEPSAGDTITATATDPDGIVGAATYQWRKFVTDDFADIQGATAATYTIPADAASGDEFQCVARYTDNYGPNQEALSFIIVVL